jgi:hypothetical protein
MMSGKKAPEQAKNLGRRPHPHADHEFNASTFAARVTPPRCPTCTQRGAGIGALKGPCTGRNEQVMLIGGEDHGPRQAEAWIPQGQSPTRCGSWASATACIAWGPRGQASSPAGAELAVRRQHRQPEILETVGARGVPEKHHLPNVDLFSAAAYLSTGIPPISSRPSRHEPRAAGPPTCSTAREHRSPAAGSTPLPRPE